MQALIKAIGLNISFLTYVIACANWAPVQIVASFNAALKKIPLLHSLGQDQICSAQRPHIPPTPRILHFLRENATYGHPYRESIGIKGPQCYRQLEAVTSVSLRLLQFALPYTLNLSRFHEVLFI